MRALSVDLEELQKKKQKKIVLRPKSTLTAFTELQRNTPDHLAMTPYVKS